MTLLILAEGENENEIDIVVGMIPCPLELPSSDGASPSSGGDSGVDSQGQGELRVYTRIQKQQHEPPPVHVPAPTNIDVTSSSSLVLSLPSPPELRGNDSFLDTSSDLALPRRIPRVNAGKPPAKFGSWETDIANYISYESIPSAYKSFIASLHSVPVPNNWQVAKQDPRWLSAMQEELQTLKKNDT